MATTATTENAIEAKRSVCKDLEDEFTLAGGPPKVFYQALIKSAKEKDGRVRNDAVKIYLQATGKLEQQQGSVTQSVIVMRPGAVHKPPNSGK